MGKKSSNRLTDDVDLKTWLLYNVTRDHFWIVYQRIGEIMQPVAEEYPDFKLSTVFAARVEPEQCSAIVSGQDGQYYWINSIRSEVPIEDEADNDDSDSEDASCGATEIALPEPPQKPAVEFSAENITDQPASTEKKQATKTHLEVFVKKAPTLTSLLAGLGSDRLFLRLKEVRLMKLTATERSHGTRRLALLEGLNQYREYLTPPESFWPAFWKEFQERTKPGQRDQMPDPLSGDTALDFADLISLPAAWIEHFPAEYRVDQLTLNGNYALLNEGMGWLKRFAHLTHLTLVNMAELTDEHVGQIVRYCPLLTHFAVHNCPQLDFRCCMFLLTMRALEVVILNQPDLCCQTNPYHPIVKEDEWHAARRAGHLRAPVKKLMMTSTRLTLDVLDQLIRYVPTLEGVIICPAMWKKLQTSMVADQATPGESTASIAFTSTDGKGFRVNRPFHLINLMKDSYQEPFSPQMHEIASETVKREMEGLESLSALERKSLEEEILREIEAEEAARA